MIKNDYKTNIKTLRTLKKRPSSKRWSIKFRTKKNETKLAIQLFKMLEIYYKNSFYSSVSPYIKSIKLRTKKKKQNFNKTYYSALQNVRNILHEFLLLFCFSLLAY